MIKDIGYAQSYHGSRPTPTPKPAAPAAPALPTVSWHFASVDQTCTEYCTASGKTCNEAAFITLNATAGLCKQKLLALGMDPHSEFIGVEGPDSGCTWYDMWKPTWFNAEGTAAPPTLCTHTQMWPNGRRLCPCE